MNKILLFVIAGALTLSGFAQNGNHTDKKKVFLIKKHTLNNKTTSQTADTVYRAGIRVNYYPDYMDNNLWIKNSVTNYTYDAGARITQEIEKDSSNINNISKDTLTYDNMWNTTLRLSQYWNVNTWVNSYQNISTYNTHNDQTEYKGQQWQNSTWFTNWGEQNDYTYDVNDNVTLIVRKNWDAYHNQYINSWKYEDTYINNLLTEETASNWDTINNIWLYDEKYMDVTWHNFAEFQPLTYTVQKYVSNNWVNSEKYTFTYTGNNYVAVTDTFVGGNWTPDKKETYSEQDTYGSNTSLYEKYISSNWVNNSKYTEVYDSKRNQTSSIDEIWQAGAWHTDWESKYIYTYDLNNSITSKIAQYWDSQTQMLKNNYKYIYSNYQQIIGIKEIAADSKINVFPNPVTEILNVYNEDYPYSVTIYNIAGQKLLDKTIISTNYYIDMSAYQKGMYIIRVISKQSAENKIIIKE